MDSRSLSFHGSCITHNLILIIVTRASFDFGEYVFVNHVESYDFKLPIRFPSLICCIWSNQNNDILICDYKVGVASSVFNFSYKLFIGKHVIGIVIPIASIVDETSMNFDEEMFYFSPISWEMRSHILKVLIHDAKVL